MKAHTKCKRRLVFGMVGMLLPTDRDDMQQVRTVVVDGAGRIISEPTEEDLALADDPYLQQAIQAPTHEQTAHAAGGSTVVDGVPVARPHHETDPEPPRESYPATRFHCNADHYTKKWHATVKGSFLEDPDARHDFVGWLTEKWPPERRTSSLSTYLSRATDRQAEALIDRARETIADRAAFAAASADLLDDDPPQDDVRGPVVDERDAVEYPDRPLDGVEYNAVALRSFYRAWSDAMRRRDTVFKPLTDNALARSSTEQLRREIASLIGQVEDIDAFLAAEAAMDADAGDDDDESQPE